MVDGVFDPVSQLYVSETFRALCDAQIGNSYFFSGATPPQTTDALVDLVFNELFKKRQGVDPANPLDDRPFWGLGVGPAPGGDFLSTGPRGINDSFLAAARDSTNLNPQFMLPRLLEPHGPENLTTTPPTQAQSLLNHPYQRMEMLSKIFNNLTTRSNVFAVWMTVGFFEVDDSSGFAKLGAEIGRAENRHVRHRMFAIIDRTQLTCFKTISTTPLVPGANQVVNIAATPTDPPTITDSRTGRQWALRDGTMLTYDPGSPQAETVVLRVIPPNPPMTTTPTLVADFRNSHAAGVPVVVYGNPGPWPRYDHRQDDCILHFAVID
jgi:hypothetical protein